jgi:FkbM family methyltransferase
MKFREMINKKIISLQKMIELPGAYSAWRKGFYVNMYSLMYPIYKMEISPKVILDIGANNGMFTKTANYLFPKAKIYSFEPLPECFKSLKTITDTHPNIRVFHCALGDTNGETTINKSQYNCSSSILMMSDLHKMVFPYSANSSKETVSIRRLDDIMADEQLLDPVLVKIDVQGYERNVVVGGRTILERAQYLICEISFKELYKGQPLFDDIYEDLSSLGFKFSGQLGELKNPFSQEVLQIDGLFIREQ